MLADVPTTIADPFSVTIAFEQLIGNNGRFQVYQGAGFTIRATAADWTENGYGRPGPAIVFRPAPGSQTSVVGEVEITADGRPFLFQRVDVYSSITQIPYVFIGLAGAAERYSVSGTQGNTFGDFVTVLNRERNTPITRLVIRLTNPISDNPMGIDNLVLHR